MANENQTEAEAVKPAAPKPAVKPLRKTAVVLGPVMAGAVDAPVLVKGVVRAKIGDQELNIIVAHNMDHPEEGDKIEVEIVEEDAMGGKKIATATHIRPPKK